MAMPDKPLYSQMLINDLSTPGYRSTLRLHLESDLDLCLIHKLQITGIGGL